MNFEIIESKQTQPESGNLDLVGICAAEKASADRTARLEKTLKATDEKVESFSEKIEINASPQDVWKLIGRFDEMKWHPALESGKVYQNPEGKTVRELVAKGGSPKFVEQLLHSDAKSITYKMTEGLPASPTATLKVEANPKGGTTVTWSGEMETSKLDAATVKGVKTGVSGFYRAGLESIKTKLEK